MWTFDKQEDGSWILGLTVESEVIDSLKWVWSAKVLIEDDSLASTITIEAAHRAPVEMPEGERSSNVSYSTSLTNGVKGIKVDEFTSKANEWGG